MHSSVVELLFKIQQYYDLELALEPGIPLSSEQEHFKPFACIPSLSSRGSPPSNTYFSQHIESP